MKETFKECMSRIGYNNNEIQEEFYNRINNFIKSDKHILINQGGMGLGKTISTSKTIQDNLNNYNLFFVATPTSPLKYTWCKEIKKIGLKQNFSIWPSKDSVCMFKKIFDFKYFNTNQCKDDCIFRRKCESSENYTTKCEILAKEYLDMLPKANPQKYYDTKILQINKTKHNILYESKDASEKKRTLNSIFRKICDIDCLYSISRMCLKDEFNRKQKIIIGDYYGFFKEKMFNLVTKRSPISGKSMLIIDEGHLLPWRAKDNGSKKIYLNADIAKLSEELKYNGQELGIIDYKIINSFIDICDKYFDICDADRTNNKNLIKFTYSNFKDDLKQLLKIKNINDDVEDFLMQLKISLEKLGGKIKNDEEGTKNPACIKIIEYINCLQNNSTKKQYHSTMRKKFYYKNKDILMNIQCIDPSEFLNNILSHWDKVIILTGTIYSKEKYLSQLGLANKENEYEYCDLLRSFSIQNNTFILNKGDFKSTPRRETYKNNSRKLTNIINKMSGKTIIFVQSKPDSNFVAQTIKLDNCNIINFCEKEDNEEMTAEDFEILKKEFSNNKSNKTVGIINIRGRVEGHNFVDEIGKFALDNIIIYGFPLDAPSDLIEAEYNYNTELFKSNKKGKVYTSLIEPINKIHQAAYRAKRNEEQNPIIILWGLRFSSNIDNIFLFKDNITGKWITLEKNNNIFVNLPDELKKREGNFDELLEFIKCVENERNTK